MYGNIAYNDEKNKYILFYSYIKYYANINGNITFLCDKILNFESSKKLFIKVFTLYFSIYNLILQVP